MDKLQSLQSLIAELVPGARLSWRELGGCGGLGGYLLEEEAALRPLPAELAERVAERPPFWSLLWPSGQALCRLLSLDPSLVRGLRVLDFGCGCGLVGCAAALSGALAVQALDIDPWARKAADLNAKGNEVGMEIGSHFLPEVADILLMADVLYDEQQLLKLDELQRNGQEVLVVDSRLQKLSWEGFSFLGECSGEAVPDLDPHREFGRLRFWYRGDRLAKWARAGHLLKSDARCSC